MADQIDVDCFKDLTIDGQLYEILLAVEGIAPSSGGITSINGDTTSAQVIAGTAPIGVATVAGTTTISSTQSGAATDGYLSSTDWNTFNNKVCGSAGAVDNSVMRADVGAGCVQNSGLIIEDTVVSVTGITGNATTDIITAPGTSFVADQPIRFSALTGGSGLNTTIDYYVINPSGNTFQVSTTAGGSFVNFTTNITAGTLLTGHSVQVNVTLSENTTETNSALVLSPKGTGAFILGRKPDGSAVGGNARGSNAVDLQTLRTSATQVASGTYAVVSGGYANTASGTYAVVSGGGSNTASGNSAVVSGGGSNIASGQHAFVSGGYANIANQQYAVVSGGGGNTASGNSAVVSGGASNTASGLRAVVSGGAAGRADRYGQQAHAAGSFAAQGDAQRARFVMRQQTTGDTPTELFLDGSTTPLTIPSNKVFGFTINICTTKQGLGEQAMFVRKGYIKNVAGTTSLIGTIETIGTDIKTAGATTTDVAITANDTNDALQVNVTGVAAENWRWVASVDAVEIAY